MSPERIGNTGMWNLFKGEYIKGDGSIIKGPQVVRVFEFDGLDFLRVQGANGYVVVVQGTDFAVTVKKRRKRT